MAGYHPVTMTREEFIERVNNSVWSFYFIFNRLMSERARWIGFYTYDQLRPSEQAILNPPALLAHALEVWGLSDPASWNQAGINKEAQAEIRAILARMGQHMRNEKAEILARQKEEFIKTLNAEGLDAALAPLGGGTLRIGDNYQKELSPQECLGKRLNDFDLCWINDWREAGILLGRQKELWRGLKDLRIVNEDEVWKEEWNIE